MTIDQNLARDAIAGDDPGVNKDVMITLRLTAADHKAFTAAADAEQLSLAAWIRRRCYGLPTLAPVPRPGRAKTPKGRR